MQFNIDLNETKNQNLIQITESFENIKQEFLKAKRLLANELKDKLHKSFSDVFELNPKIKAVSWTQYTPYFMDGDTCTFSINEVNFLTFIPQYPREDYSDFTDDEENVTEEDFAVNSYKLHTVGLTPEGIDALKRFNTFINNNEDLMEEAFGDHVHILMTVDHLEIEEYEHD